MEIEVHETPSVFKVSTTTGSMLDPYTLLSTLLL
jgi:hypothetical protein